MGLEAFALTRGQVFAKDYRIVRRLGQGGMGGVYLAEQRSTHAPRALKLMHPHLVADTVLRKRFEQEAQVGARVRSDHIVHVLAAGVDEDTGIPWLAMELLEGETLAAIAKRDAPLDRAYVGEVFLQLCHALGSAHRVGIVHRDLKPENVFICSAQRPGVAFTLKVLDFGIAKVVAEAQTRSTEPLGTPLWMSPEQTQHGEEIGPRADVWALGLIAFYLLTGKHYWRGAYVDTNAMKLLREIAYEPLADARARAKELGVEELLPDGFEAWFERVVTRDVSARFADAAEAQAALAPILGTPAVVLGPNVSSPPTDALEGVPSSRDASGTRAIAGLGSAPPRLESEIEVTAKPSSRTARNEARPLDARHVAMGFAAAVAFAVMALFAARRLASPPVTPPSSIAPAPSVVESARVTTTAPPVASESAMPVVSAPPAIASSAPQVHAPAAKPKRKFDEAAARRQFEQLEVAAGRCLNDDSGMMAAGMVSVSFAADGSILNGVVMGVPDNAAGTCIRSVMMSARVAPFDGEPQHFSMGFSVRRTF